MEKNRWLEFISGKIKSQIALENSHKLQTWGFALLFIFSLGLAFSTVGTMQRTYLFGTKVLFCILANAIVALAFYLPSLLQRGENSAPQFLGVRDFTGLILTSLTLLFCCAVVLTVSFQVIDGAKMQRMSGFFTTIAWINVALGVIYAVKGILFFMGLSMFPGFLKKASEQMQKAAIVFAVLHGVVAVCFSFSYHKLYPLGTPQFFDQFRLAGLFWLALGAGVFFVGKMIRESVNEPLQNLEFDIASGSIEKKDDVMARFRQAFVSNRLSDWLAKLSHGVATRSHEIARNLHEAVSLVSRQKPAESDLRRVEDSYKKAASLCRKIEKQNNKFLICLALFSLSEAEKEAADELQDQFSKELRNAKLELSSVRKRIDNKLVHLKDAQPADPETVPVQELPLSS